MKETFEVKYVNCKHNFLTFNENVMKKFNNQSKAASSPVYQLFLEKSCKGAFTPSPSSLQELTAWQVGLSAVVGQALSVPEGATVTLVNLQVALPVARSVCVSPATQEDFEILELNSMNIQDHLLDQLQSVAVRQAFVVWPTPHLHVTLIVDCAEPASEMVLLNNTTELHVSPQVHTTVQTPPGPSVTPSVSWSGIKKSLLDWIGGEEEEETPQPCSQQAPDEQEMEMIFRVHPLPGDNANPCVIVTHPNHSPSQACIKVDLVWPQSKDHKGFHAQVRQDNTVTAIEPLSRFPIIYVSGALLKKLDIEAGSKVVCLPLDARPCESLVCHVTGEAGGEEVRRGLLSLATAEGGQLLLSTGVRLRVEGEVQLSVELPGREVAVMTTGQLERCAITVKPAAQQSGQEITESVEPEMQESLHPLKGWQGIQEEVTFSVKHNLVLERSPRSVVVLRGPSGSGKSALLRRVGQQLTAHPSCVHWAFVDCRLIKGKQLENLRGFFLKRLQECARLQPAVLLLENLEAFCPPPSAEPRESPEAAYCRSVQEMILDLSLSCTALHAVCVVVTTSNEEAFRWPHEISPIEYLDMPDLSSEDKAEALSRLLRSRARVADSLVSCTAGATEGYRIQDVQDLADRILFAMWKRRGSGSTCDAEVQRSDVRAALAEFVPQGLRGVKLHSARAAPLDLEEAEEVQRWANVGGLHEIKRNLTELIEWPSKYPELFSSAPLKLQAGVLLYGAPGAGKTLLAAELARGSGANFISVKGPELLSMYIGASEQAVRDLFHKAHSAKPCILFFDEFDSLAPSRGRDTTGVSDRVVNQLLTSLDGVDSPVEAGVWVVAATSRPDLIDRALLRPGRLDSVLHCPLPSQEEREEILHVLARRLSAEVTELRLPEVARRTPGFSGADLQALLYSAQLAALEEALGDFELEGSAVDQHGQGVEELGTAPPHVTWHHVEHALSTARPALDPREAAKYARIYDDFEKSRMPGESKNFIPQQRTALA